MNELTTQRSTKVVGKSRGSEQVFVTVYVDKQLFGMHVERVQDILVPEKIAHIPLSPPEIAGAINLRGRIVTVVDVRKRLNLPPLESGERMCTTVEQGSELYSLMVDSVGAVINLPMERIETNPSTLEARWRSISSGVVRLENELMIVLDVDKLLTFSE